MDLEAVWALREDEVYPAIFGTLSRGIFPLSAATFQPFKNAAVDPCWLTYGVMEYSPSATRSSWVYVTSGHSNPWEVEPENYSSEGESGAGIEFTLETPSQADWAIVTLQQMLALDLLMMSGHFGDQQSLGIANRIPLGGPINGKDACVLRNLLVIQPSTFQEEFQLPSGTVKLIEFMGITDAERELAKEKGFGDLKMALEAAGHWPITDPDRGSIA